MEEKRIEDFISMMTKNDKEASQKFGNAFFKYCSKELGIKKTTVEKEFREFLNKDGGLVADYVDILTGGEYEVPKELDDLVHDLFKENGVFYDKLYKPESYPFSLCILLFHDMMIKKYIFHNFDNYIERITGKMYNEKYTEYLYDKENIIMFYVKELLYMNMTHSIPKKYIDMLSEYGSKKTEIVINKSQDDDFKKRLSKFQNIGNSFDDNSAILYYCLCNLFIIDEFYEDLIDIILSMYKKQHPKMYQFLLEQEVIDFEDLNMYLLSMQDYCFGVDSSFAIKTIALYAVLANKKIKNLEKYINIDPHYKHDMFLSELLSVSRIYPSFYESANEYYDKEVEKLYKDNGITDMFVNFESVFNHDAHHFFMDNVYSKHFFMQVLSTFGLFYYNHAGITTPDMSKMAYTYLFNPEKEKTIDDYKKIEKILLRIILSLSMNVSSLKVEKTNTMFNEYLDSLDVSKIQVDYNELQETQEKTIEDKVKEMKEVEQQKYENILSEKDKKIQELALAIERLTNETNKLKTFISSEKEKHHIEEADILEEFEQIEQDNISLEEMISFIQKYKIKYIGGHISVHNRLKELFPNWDFYEGGNGFHWNENEVFKSTDYCILHFTKIGHGESGKIKRAIENYKIPMIYVSNNNIERIITNIYQDIQNNIVEKEEIEIEK